MANPVAEAVQRVRCAAWAFIDPPAAAEDVARRAASEALTPIRELHKPYWDNCINACCSGAQCKNRTRRCEGGCDEWVNDAHDFWPCATARLAYSADEIADLTFSSPNG